MTMTYLSAPDVARRLNVSPMTIHRLINDGHLQATRVGRQYRIAEDEVDRYVAEHRTVLAVKA